MALTRRQKEVMDFLSNFIQQNDIAQLRRNCGGSAPCIAGDVHKHIQALEQAVPAQEAIITAGHSR